MWFIADRKYWEHLHVPQGRPSIWAPGLLLYEVNIGGTLFFRINERERKRERERGIDKEWIESEIEREVGIERDIEIGRVRE